jgi:DNA adenine methylase
VAHHVRWPVSEVDLHARQWWLSNDPEEIPKFIGRMRTDPDHYDPEIAGWWVYGQCLWIGSGWCEHVHEDRDFSVPRTPRLARPDLGGSGKGVVVLARNSSPDDDRLAEYLEALSARFRNVRVCCGDWTRICGPAPTTGLGLTAVFLDPPYADETGRYRDLYSSDSRSLSHQVRDWCHVHGDDSLFRIALCGYEGEHVMPNTWECFAWKAPVGYAGPRRNGVNDNAQRERIWFSPHCLKPEATRTLFDMTPSDESELEIPA